MSDYITGERLPKTMRKKVNEIIVDSPSDFFVWLNKPFAFEPHENEAIASHCCASARPIPPKMDSSLSLHSLDLCITSI